MKKLREIAERTNKENVTLLFAARDTEHDSTRALAAFVRELVRDAQGAGLRRAASRLGETPRRRTTDRNPRPSFPASPLRFGGGSTGSSVRRVDEFLPADYLRPRGECVERSATFVEDVLH